MLKIRKKFIVNFYALYFFKLINSINAKEALLCESTSNNFALFFIKNFHKIPIVEANVDQIQGDKIMDFVKSYLNNYMTKSIEKEENGEIPMNLSSDIIKMKLNVLVDKGGEQCQKVRKNQSKNFLGKFRAKIDKTFKKGELKNSKIIKNEFDGNFILCIYHFLYIFCLEFIKNIANDQSNKMNRDELSQIKQIYLNLYGKSLKKVIKYFKMNFEAENCFKNSIGIYSLPKEREMKTENYEENLSANSPFEIISKFSDKSGKYPKNITSKEIAKDGNKITKFVKKSIANLNFGEIKKILALKWFAKIFANLKKANFIIFTDLIKLKDILLIALRNDKSPEESQKKIISLADNILLAISSNQKCQKRINQALSERKLGTNDDKMIKNEPFICMNKMIEMRKSYHKIGPRAKRQIGTDIIAMVGYCTFYFGLAVLFIGAPIVAAVFLSPALLALFFVTGWVGVPAAKVFFENCILNI